MERENKRDSEITLCTIYKFSCITQFSIMKANCAIFCCCLRKREQNKWRDFTKLLTAAQFQRWHRTDCGMIKISGKLQMSRSLSDYCI